MFFLGIRPLSALFVVSIALSAQGQVGSSMGGYDQAGMVDESPWQFSVGLRARRLRARFEGPGPLNPLSLYSPKTNGGKGDVGLMLIPDRQIAYDDGFVGPDQNFRNPGTAPNQALGEAAVLINYMSQFSPAQPISQGPSVIPGQFRFHTSATMYSYQSTFASLELEATASAAGPYAQLSREVARWESSSLGLSLAWSFMRFDAGTDPQIVSRQTISELRHDIYYEYSYATLQQTLLSPLGEITGGGGQSGIIYDPDIVFANNSISLVERPPAPSKSIREKTRHRTVSTVTAVSQNRLDVKFSDLGMTADWSFAPASWCQIGIAAGPTLNLLSYDYSNRTQWYLNGHRFASSRVAQSDTELKVGVRAGLHLLCNLNKSGSWFLELFGGYDWVDALGINVGGSDVEIDASSWTGQCGMGIRF